MNVAAYSEALDRFLLEMEKLTEPYSWEVQAALDDLCEIFRISRIDFWGFETAGNEEAGNGEKVTCYLKDIPNTISSYVGRHMTTRGRVLVFKYYMKLGSDHWNQEEADKIKVFDAVIYSFITKIKLTKFVENALFYDRDMNIPNMNFYHREIRRLVAANCFNEYAVCFFNLKRYSVINQLLGRELGTRVMAKYVSELQQLIKENGYVCRVGGDNFVIVFRQSEVDSVVAYLAGREIVYDDSSGAGVMVKASSGIYMGDEDDINGDDPTEKAHIALQGARQRVDKNYMFYNEELQNRHEHASKIESIFREAIGKEEFQVYYQPKVQLSDYAIAGAEALCRWVHKGDFIMPDDFIPILENSNSICTLDFYMLEHVCRDIRKWLDRGLNVVRVSVNLSRRHLGDEKLLDKILEIIDKYSVPHEYIEIELTETTTDIAFNDLKKIVNGLHDHGIHTSVDDFGVGYSSLNLIRQVAWDVIKIDKSFLPNVSDKSSSQYLMFSHLMSMFRELGLKCIVEGVETLEQVKMLKENKCYLAQGYFFDRPIQMAEFETRLVSYEF